MAHWLVTRFSSGALIAPLLLFVDKINFCAPKSEHKKSKAAHDYVYGNDMIGGFTGFRGGKTVKPTRVLSLAKRETIKRTDSWDILLANI